MLGWFRALMPKEDRFFDLFERHAATLVDGAAALTGSARRQRRRAGGLRAPSPAHEDEADEITREALLAVRRTFITPFDRSDIQALVSSLDDAIDQMQKTAKAVQLFEVTAFEPAMREMGGDHPGGGAASPPRPCRCCGRIGENATRLNALTERVIQLEGRADDIHNDGPEGAVPGVRGRTPWPSSSGPRSTTIWRR